MRTLMAIDAGTTAFKAALYDETRALLASAKADYTLLTNEDGRVEFDALAYRDMAFRLIDELLSRSGVAPEAVTAVALSSQAETLICVDADNRPLRNAIVWLDNRAVREADELRERFGRRAVYERCGQADMLATWPAAKLLWLKRNEPRVFDATRRFLLLEDYLIACLTGRAVGEPTLWASSALYDTRAGGWWQGMLDALGLDEDRLPTLLPCGSPAARVRPCSGLALTEATLVATGALDQSCGALGAGVTRNGEAAVTMGSCLAVNALCGRFAPWDEARAVTCQPSPIAGQWSVLLWSQTAGMALKWLAEGFYPDVAARGLSEAYARINEEAARVPPGSEGLVMLPHLSGAGYPELDANARGVFFGLGLRHTRSHCARALMESVGYMLRGCIERVERPDRLVCMGGGANSPLWLDILASVTGTEIVRAACDETACMGAALLAGVGAGVWSSAEEAARGMARTSAARLPAPDALAVYDKGYRMYGALYQALKGSFADWAGITKE